MTWKHDELAADLAQYLRNDQTMVWLDMQLGPSGSPRPDVYTIQRSYSRPLPSAFEVKISRSDLRSDTTSGKWQKYLRFAGAVTFAVPEGLATVADIPDSCGLIVRKAAVWRYARRPTRQNVTLPMDACMKLLIDGVDRSVGARAVKPRTIATWEAPAAVRKKFGEAVAIAARDLHAAEQRCASARETADYERARVDTEMANYKARLKDQIDREFADWSNLQAEIKSALGFESNVSLYGARTRLQKMIADCDADARVKAMSEQLYTARRSLEHALSALPERPRFTLGEAA